MGKRLRNPRLAQHPKRVTLSVIPKGKMKKSIILPGVSITLDLTEANVFSILEKVPLDERVTDISLLPVHPFILTLVFRTLAGLTLNGIAGFGEELEWRGLL